MIEMVRLAAPRDSLGSSCCTPHITNWRERASLKKRAEGGGGGGGGESGSRGRTSQGGPRRSEHGLACTLYRGLTCAVVTEGGWHVHCIVMGPLLLWIYMYVCEGNNSSIALRRLDFGRTHVKTVPLLPNNFLSWRLPEI